MSCTHIDELKARKVSKTAPIAGDAVGDGDCTVGEAVAEADGGTTTEDEEDAAREGVVEDEYNVADADADSDGSAPSEPVGDAVTVGVAAMDPTTVTLPTRTMPNVPNVAPPGAT